MCIRDRCYIKTLTINFHRVEVLVDSRAALTACFFSNKIPPLFAKCRELLLDLNSSVLLIWIPSHCGHPGNELADRLANKGSKLGDHLAVPLDTAPCARRSAAKQAIAMKWNLEWSASTNSSTTKKFFPSTLSFLPLANSIIPRQVIHLITGHSRLLSHQFRLSFSPSPTCPCGLGEETTEHFLFVCALHSTTRSIFKTACLSSLSVWPPPLYAIPQSPHVWNSLVNFVIHSGRLN